ncbi:MAG TPA: hypothetical protein PKA27_16215 [Fimbriimonadaceae bacterium]|nr:hypothetical protein [Fimbriimonadaceae bacterium]
MAMPHGLEQNEDPRDLAESWLARFAPLLLEDPARSQNELESQLRLIGELRNSAPELRSRLLNTTGADLLTTIDRASAQLESLEDDLRLRLGKVAPGHPESRPDLEKLNERLAERMAKQELGLPTANESRLDLKLSSGSIAAAGFTGLFGLGWTAFTTVHCIFMIGGMWKAFGPIALALLLFYSIFFAVGFAMLGAAFSALWSESVALEGEEFVIRRTLGPWVREKRHILGPESVASLEDDASGFRSNNSRSRRVVSVLDANGNAITFGSNANEVHRQMAVEKINEYLRAHR